LNKGKVIEGPLRKGDSKRKGGSFGGLEEKNIA